ncbi:alpha/beta hydrolase [candidate division WWE3 bacterium]|uniref:Alpha/beta hydrolase n=1 Tax=candidate division WWE3 bacterium TaxID=2053526 RepID=A0A955LI85_UNCKA|nr:alpha/beta hydrolase [candidate division WWE3 bacterium]
MKKNPPAITYHHLQLPTTNLHYCRCGEGPPLILVPATLSEIHHWKDLVQFMGQRYTVYFFELPGHGESTAFVDGYSSKKVATMVGDLTAALGIERFSVMGFSFGGILSLRIVQQLEAKIDSLILVSPCVSYRALTYTKVQISLVRILDRIFKSTMMQRFVTWIAHHEATVEIIVFLTRYLGNIRLDDTFRERLLTLPMHTLDVLINQINEVVYQDFDAEGWTPEQKKNISTYFAMSVNDPILDFETTRKWIEAHFTSCQTVSFDFPYHQPPVPLTFEDFNRDFGDFLFGIPINT